MKTSIALVLTLLACGCYTSPVPVGNLADAAQIASLEGVWVGEKAEDGFEQIQISALETGEYRILFQEDGEDYYLRGFVTEVEGVYFASLLDETQPEEGYMLFRFTMDDANRLEARLVGGDLIESESFDSPASILAFVSEHRHDEALYDDEGEPLVLIRQADE